MICFGVLFTASACGEKNESVKDGDDLLAGTGMSLEDFDSFSESSSIGNVPDNLIGTWHRGGGESTEQISFQADGTGTSTKRDAPPVDFEWALDGDILTIAWDDDPDGSSCLPLKATARNIAIIDNRLYADVYTFIRADGGGPDVDGSWEYINGESRDWSDCYVNSPEIQSWQDRTTLQITGDSYALVDQYVTWPASESDKAEGPFYGEMTIDGDYVFLSDMGLSVGEFLVLLRADDNVLVFVGMGMPEDLANPDLPDELRSMTEWIKE
jgi:hypothetical protein